MPAWQGLSTLHFAIPSGPSLCPLRPLQTYLGPLLSETLSEKGVPSGDGTPLESKGSPSWTILELTAIRWEAEESLILGIFWALRGKSQPSKQMLPPISECSTTLPS